MTRKSVKTLRVMVVEEQELFRKGLRTALERGGLTVVAEYDSTAAVLESEAKEEELGPGTVVLCSLTLEDWQMLAHHLHLRAPACPVLGMVNQVTDKVAMSALSSGILGFIDRALPLAEWVERIRDVHAGKVSPALMLLQYPATARLALMLLSQPLPPPGLNPLAPVLGHRERLILGNVSEQVPVDVMAQQMGVSEQAVHWVLDSTCHKLVARQRLSGTLEQLR